MSLQLLAGIALTRTAASAGDVGHPWYIEAVETWLELPGLFRYRRWAKALCAALHRHRQLPEATLTWLVEFFLRRLDHLGKWRSGRDISRAAFATGRLSLVELFDNQPWFCDAVGIEYLVRNRHWHLVDHYVLKKGRIPVYAAAIGAGYIADRPFLDRLVRQLDNDNDRSSCHDAYLAGASEAGHWDEFLHYRLSPAADFWGYTHRIVVAAARDNNVSMLESIGPDVKGLFLPDAMNECVTSNRISLDAMQWLVQRCHRDNLADGLERCLAAVLRYHVPGREDVRDWLADHVSEPFAVLRNLLSEPPLPVEALAWVEARWPNACDAWDLAAAHAALAGHRQGVDYALSRIRTPEKRKLTIDSILTLRYVPPEIIEYLDGSRV